MNIFLVGLNHGRTPVAIRGKLAISTSILKESLASLHAYVPKGIILSTCNRTEVYAVGQKEEEIIPRTIDFFSARANLSEKELSRYIYILQDGNAVKHLYGVASGLDSMIVGEHEILGQVKSALKEAQSHGPVALPLLNLFQSAIRLGRRVRIETGISKHALSVSSMAVDLAQRVVGDIRKSKIVIIGAGEAGKKVALAARERGTTQLVVVSRDQKRGRDLAEILKGAWAPMAELDQELTDCKILICCSGAPHFLVKYERLKKVMGTRAENPIVIIDIAVPPDVDPDLKHLKNVFLYDIDELNKACHGNQRKRRKEISAAEKMINYEAERFESYWKTLEIRPVISSLVQKADNIRQTQLELTLKKIKRLSEDESDYLEAMTKAIMRRILHDPIQCLKRESPKRYHYMKAVNDLFDLEGTDFRK